MATSGLSAIARAIASEADAVHAQTFMTQVGHELGEMHGDDGAVFDDQHSHHLPCDNGIKSSLV